MTVHNDKAFKAEYSVSVWILKAENKQLKKQIEIQNTCIEELKSFMNLSKEHKKNVMEYINRCEEV